MLAYVTPHENHPYRSLFEGAYKQENHLLLANITLDTRVERLQRAIFSTTPCDPPNIQQEIAAMQHLAQETLAQNYREGRGSWNEHFRLMSHARFLEQRVMIPFAFSNPGNFDTLRYLANGIHGVSVEILKEALKEYREHHTKKEREELRGAIHEQTAMALINRGDRNRHFALPASTGDDMLRRADIDYWRLPDRQSQHEHIPIQIKTRLHHIPERAVAPKHGIVITAEEMHNFYQFRAADLLVRELDNELVFDNLQGIDELSELNEIQQHLRATIDTKYAAVQARLQKKTPKSSSTHDASSATSACS